MPNGLVKVVVHAKIDILSMPITLTFEMYMAHIYFYNITMTS